MKILIVSEPGIGGVAQYVDTLCRFLIDEGIEVHLAYSDRRHTVRLGSLLAEIERSGGSVLNLRTSNFPQFADVSAFFRLWRMVVRLKPDVIHSHSSKAGVLARVLRFCGVTTPQVYHPHAFAGMRPERGFIDGVYDGIERIFGKAGTVVATSRGEQAYATERLGIPDDRVALLLNGVDTSRFRPAALDEKLRIRRAHGLPAGGLILGFMGRSSSQKDPVTLYHAFAKAAAEDPNLYLFHVGEGELDGALDKLATQLGITHRITRLAFTAEPTKFYQAIDGFILPSKYEGFSLALLEALAADLPLITSDAPGNRELAGEGLTHFAIVSPGDADGFSQKITAWATAVRSGGQPNHRAIAEERFQLRHHLRELTGIYARVSENRKPLRQQVLKPV